MRQGQDPSPQITWLPARQPCDSLKLSSVCLLLSESLCVRNVDGCVREVKAEKLLKLINKIMNCLKIRAMPKPVKRLFITGRFWNIRGGSHVMAASYFIQRNWNRKTHINLHTLCVIVFALGGNFLPYIYTSKRHVALGGHGLVKSCTKY